MLPKKGKGGGVREEEEGGEGKGERGEEEREGR